MAPEIKQTFQPLNLTIVQGADFDFYVEAEAEDGAPADLAGCVVEAQVRQTPEAEPFSAFTCTVNGNRVDFHLPAAESEKIAWKSGVWDSFLTDPQGFRRPFAAGQVKGTRSVTPLPASAPEPGPEGTPAP